MNRDAIDLRVMRRGLISLAVGGVVGGLILGAGVYFRLSEQHAFDYQTQRYHEAQAREQKAQRAVVIAAREWPRFEQLRAAGVLGPEPRLDWVATLRQVSDPLRLPSLQYKIEPQASLQLDYMPVNGNYDIKASAMHLMLQSGHEGDVVRILDGLAGRARGLFQVQECLLQRLSADLQLDITAPNVAAECTLRWLSIDYGAGVESGSS
jgi:hypothetical protein